MRRMSLTQRLVVALLAGTLAGIPFTRASAADEKTPPVVAESASARRPIQLAICLDTSGSMSGLLNAARSKLWSIVNDLATAKPVPELHVALFSFGNDGYPAEGGWVTMLTPFTRDLDLVSEKLFGLTTNGGTELVGRVLNDAIEQLPWSSANDTLRIIIVAGNESADQDQQVPYRDVCARAIAKGILVNSVYCGNPTDGDAPGWREAALLADGHFASIDQDNAIAIDTPFDVELATLSGDLNATYIPFGTSGSAGVTNQIEQDLNAANMGPSAAAERGLTKQGCQYSCGTWDLVDALDAGSVTLESLTADALPAEMRTMSLEERAAHVAKLKAKRAEVRERMSKLAPQREVFIAKALEERTLDDGSAFDRAIRTAIRAQAAAKGFVFEAPAANAAAPAAAEPQLPENNTSAEKKLDDC